MDTTAVFLSGDTSASILRGIFEPGSREVMSAWAKDAGLSVEAEAGLTCSAQPLSSLAAATGSSRVIRQLLDGCPIPPELLGDTPEVLFASSSDKARQIDLVSRLWMSDIPADAFLAVGPEVHLSCPAFTLVLRARSLGLFGAMSYGNELCGRFSLDKSPRGMNDHPPFASRANIKTFLSACGRGKGTKNARVAAKWIRDGFRSPKESDLYLSLRLPRDYGGYGFRRDVEVNGHVVVAPELRYISGVASYEVDLLWRREKVVVEYDGDPHDDPRQKLQDDLKSHVLREMGFEVFRISWDILSDVREFDYRARMLGARLGEPVPFSTREFLSRRSRLREALFHGPR